VHRLMLGQFTLGLESLWALVALEWPFSRVHEHMIREVIRAIEGLATIRTLVGSCIAVTTLMTRHIAQETERLATFWAWIRFLSRMDTLMHFDFTETSKTLEANGTFMFLLPSVSFGMSSQSR